MVLFGGIVFPGVESGHLGDGWVWDGRYGGGSGWLHRFGPEGGWVC